MFAFATAATVNSVFVLRACVFFLSSFWDGSVPYSLFARSLSPFRSPSVSVSVALTQAYNIRTACVFHLQSVPFIVLHKDELGCGFSRIVCNINDNDTLLNVCYFQSYAFYQFQSDDDDERMNKKKI